MNTFEICSRRVRHGKAKPGKIRISGGHFGA